MKTIEAVNSNQVPNTVNNYAGSCKSLLDLLNSVQNASKSTFDVAIPANDSQTLARVLKPQLNSLITRYAQYVNDLESVTARQQEFEKQLFGKSITESVPTKCVSSIVEVAIRALVTKAEKTFAPSGGTLKIDSNDVLEATNQSDWAVDFGRRRWLDRKADPTPKVDLDLIWAYLENTYGGEAGALAGYRQQASILVDHLNLDNEESIKRTSSHVSCFITMYGEKQMYGKGTGKYQPGYHYRDKIQQVCMAITCFAEWAGLDSLAINLHPSRHDLCDYDLYYTPREKRQFPGLEIVLFKDKWALNFSHEVAEKLMHFLGEHASQP